MNEYLFKHKNNVKRSRLCKKNIQIYEKNINQLKIIKLIFTN